MVKKSLPQLEKLASSIRYQTVLMSHRGKASHLGSALSCVDLLVAAYWSFLKIDAQKPSDRLRDRFFLSKGHAVSALYACLAEKGFFPKEWLQTFNQDGNSLPEHPSPGCAPGVELASGSLGHGLSVGLGHALAGKILNENYRVVVLLSDGECNEGSTWEGALFAPAQQLKNVIVIIDYNKWQATGRSETIMQISPLREKWEAFGWETMEIDGHNMAEILTSFSKISDTKPTAIIAHTVKGKGISFMEDDNNWHYRIPNKEEVLKAKQELGVLDCEKCVC